jgi:ParB family chromosome partitioning protein
MPTKRPRLAAFADSAVSDAGPGAGPAGKLNKLTERINTSIDYGGGRMKRKAQILIEPEKCRMWEHHNRLYELLTPQNCASLIADIESAGGQKIPAIVRAVESPTPDLRFEVIAGARRHFAVTYLREVKGRKDILYLVQEEALTDEEAFRVSDLENRNREDISDYERALDYEAALGRYYEGNVARMAGALGVAEHYLRSFHALASLPLDIVTLFEDPRQLTRKDASRLKPLLSDVKRSARVYEEAAKIAEQNRFATEGGGRFPFSAGETVRRLEAAAAGARSRKETVKLAAPGGKTATLEVTPRSVSLRIPRSKSLDVDKLAAELERLLGEGG